MGFFRTVVSNGLIFNSVKTLVISGSQNKKERYKLDTVNTFLILKSTCLP